MIIASLNDPQCLGLLHEICRERVEHPAFIQFAQAFHCPAEIAAFIRTRPARLDFGDPLDGPRIACVPSQRLRALPNQFNCFEATGTYLPLAEIIDPGTARTSCTIRVGAGYHTFPVERNRAVILDPDPPPRNAIDAGVYECARRNGLRASLVEAGEAPEWLFRVAANAARSPVERRAVRNAARAVNQTIVHGEPLEDLGAISRTIALAETAAGLWGEDGHDALAHATRSVRNLQQKADLGEFKGLAKKMGKGALEALVLSQTGPVGLAILKSVRDKSEAGQDERENTAVRARRRGKSSRRHTEAETDLLDLMNLH